MDPVITPIVSTAGLPPHIRAFAKQYRETTLGGRTDLQLAVANYHEMPAGDLTELGADLLRIHTTVQHHPFAGEVRGPNSAEGWVARVYFFIVVTEPEPAA